VQGTERGDFGISHHAVMNLKGLVALLVFFLRRFLFKGSRLTGDELPRIPFPSLCGTDLRR